MRGKDIIPKGVVVASDVDLPVLQVDAKLGGVVKLHIFPFGQAHHRIRVGHNLVDDNVESRGLINRKRHANRAHGITPIVFYVADSQCIIDSVANLGSHFKHYFGWGVAKNDHGRMSQAVINGIIIGIQCRSLIKSLVERELQMRHVKHLAGQELWWSLVYDAGADIHIVEIHLLGIA